MAILILQIIGAVIGILLFIGVCDYLINKVMDKLFGELK